MGSTATLQHQVFESGMVVGVPALPEGDALQKRQRWWLCLNLRCSKTASVVATLALPQPDVLEKH